MNRFQQFTLISALLSLCSFSAPSLAGDEAKDYIQLVSYENQFASSPRKLATFKLVNGSILHKDASHVTVSQDGLYFVLISVEVGADPKVAATTTGYLDLWLEKNNQPINFSSSRNTVRSNELSTITTQAIVMLKKDDTISVKFSSNNPKIGLISIPDPASSPAISSINLSLYKI